MYNPFRIFLAISMESSDYRKIIFTLLALSAAIQSLAFTITGRIMTGKKPVPEIVVKVTDKDGNELGHSTTDNNGKFSLSHINTGTIVVETKGDGYVPIRLEVVTGETDTDLGMLSLDKVVDLEEVTVTASNRINAPGKTIVYATRVEKERAASPFNMLTILSYKAPQIHVRESERILTINGEEPEILINGVKRPMSFISTIKSDAIDKIEFSSMSDIRFGKRYLNIITKRSSEGGWLMADVTGGITTPRYFFRGAAEYSKGKNDFMLYYDGGYRDGSKEYTDEEEHYTGGGKEIILGVKGKPSSTIDSYHNLNFYFTRIQTVNSMFSVVGSLNFHNNNQKIYDRATDLSETYDRSKKRGYRQVNPILNIYYQLKPSQTASVEINAAGSYNDFNSHRNLDYSTGYSSLLSTDSRSWYFSTEVLWKQQLPFGWLNTGTSLSHNNASNDYVIDGTASHQPLSSTRLNLYTSLGGNLFKVGYNLSAGLSYYKVENEIISPNLTASLQKNLGNDFGISYNFRYNPVTPPMTSYNETATPVNDLMYHIGTDRLKSQHDLSNQIQIEYNKNKFYISLQSTVNSISRPLVTDYIYQQDSGKPFFGYFIETPGNGRSFLSYGADCNVGLSNLWNFLSLKASTGWGHNKLKSAETFTVCSWYLDFSAGMYWKGWQLNLTAENMVPSWSMHGLNGKIRHWPYVSLTIYKSFGNWNLHASWNNLFSRYGGRYRTETLSSVVTRSSEFRMNDQGNMLEIGVRYQFTTGKLLNKKSRSINLSGNGENGIRWDY